MSFDQSMIQYDEEEFGQTVPINYEQMDTSEEAVFYESEDETAKLMPEFQDQEKTDFWNCVLLGDHNPTFVDTTNSERCRCAQKCPRIVDCANMDFYLSIISDMEVQWFHTMCFDRSKVTYEDYQKGVFYNHMAYVHWRKWGTQLVELAKKTTPKHFFAPRINENKDSYKVAAYLTRSNLECFPPSMPYLLDAPVSGGYINFKGWSMVPFTSEKDRYYRGWGEERISSDMRLKSSHEPVTAERYDTLISGTFYTYLGECLKGTPFYFEADKLMMQTSYGTFVLEVSFPEPTYAVERAIKNESPLFPLVVPMSPETDTVDYVYFGKLNEENVLFGLVEQGWFLWFSNPLEEKVVGLRPRFERHCTCITNRFWHSIHKIGCMQHGVTINWLGWRIWIGDKLTGALSIDAHVWMRYKWSHASRREGLYVATEERSIVEPLCNKRGKWVYSAPCTSESAVFLSWPYANPFFGLPVSYVINQRQIPYAVDFSGSTVWYTVAKSLPEAICLPQDLIVLLLLHLPELKLMIDIFVMVHEIEKNKYLTAPGDRCLIRTDTVFFPDRVGPAHSW